MKFVICMFLLVVSNVVVAAECERLREYDEITAVVTDKFYDKTFKGLDWPARVAHYRMQIDCGKDANGLAAVVNALLSELKASHTALYTVDDLDYWALQAIFSRSMDQFAVAFSGIWPHQRDGAWFAKYVLPQSPAEKAGVHAGDELLSIDGRPFHPLGFKEGTTATLRVSGDGATEREIRIAPLKQNLQKFLLDATRASGKVMSVGAAKVGYFHLWSGTHDLFKQSLNSALSDFEKQRVDALILDLRGGFGGSGPEYLDQLKGSQRLAQIPKYFLIDDGVRSGKELVAATVRSQRIGTLVGSRTAGAFLGGSPFRFADKYLLYVAVDNSERFMTDIDPLEGIGLRPDIEVAPCRAFCAGRDPQLDKVIELIRALPRTAA